MNLSANQLLDRSFPGVVKKLLGKYDFPPSSLEFEITERIMPHDMTHMVEMLDELKKLHVRIAIDDFGTEYSSLSFLKQLPIDRIKIAKNFIDGIGRSQQDESIIAAIALLCKKLNLDLIAEGVEETLQLNYLKQTNCPAIQGFYFHKPMNKREVGKLFQDFSGSVKETTPSTKKHDREKQRSPHIQPV